MQANPPRLIILAALGFLAVFRCKRLQKQVPFSCPATTVTAQSYSALISSYEDPLLSGWLLSHTNTAAIHRHHLLPVSPTLCQAEARLTTMWISIPHTRWAELCPAVPNHQQCAFCCTHTPTSMQQDETCCSKHTRPQKEPRKLLLWPISRASLQSPDQ